MTESGPAVTVDGRSGRLEFSAPATLEILDLVHTLVEHLWATHDVPEQHRVRFETSVIEILGNVVEHAFTVGGGSCAGRRFDIMLDVSDVDVVARLSDNGFPAELDLSGAIMPDELAESGRGVALAAAALDQLSYRRDAGRNIWDLVLLRSND